jgi:hypothetical protein
MTTLKNLYQSSYQQLSITGPELANFSDEACLTFYIVNLMMLSEPPVKERQSITPNIPKATEPSHACCRKSVETYIMSSRAAE